MTKTLLFAEFINEIFQERLKKIITQIVHPYGRLWILRK